MEILTNKKLITRVKELSKENHDFKFDIDTAMFLLSQIQFGTFNKESIDEQGWVSLCSNILRKTIGKNYSKYLQIFYLNDLIEKQNYCTECKKCSKYRITEEYDSGKLKKHQILNWICIRRISKSNRVMASAIKKYPHLWKWFNCPKLTLDIPNAIKELKALKLSRKKIKKNYLSITNFNSNRKWFIRHAKDKRLHTNLTNMKSEIRKHLRYKGKKMVNIDIKNSQIFFLMVIVEKIFNQTPVPNITYTMSHLFSLPLNIWEIRKLKNLVLSGQFYPELGKKLIKEKTLHGVYEKRKFSKKFNSKISDFYDDPKKLMKETTFEVLFSKNCNKSPEKEWFEKEFPSIMRLIKKIKEKNHTRLALILQNLEAHVILDIATKRIHQFNKDIPIFTVHDSIMTTEENTEDVKRILIESVNSFTGYTPSISIE